MDAGPILDQSVSDVGAQETARELGARLADLGADLLLRNLPNWLRSQVEVREQDESQATYTSLLTKDDGRIDWNKDAASIARQVRAYDPWPGAFSFWEERQLRILQGYAGQGEGSPGLVLELSGSCLRIASANGVVCAERVQLAGGKPMGARDLVVGHPTIIGSRLGEGA
jgi:methionyl-tRNA formyltransferase